MDSQQERRFGYTEEFSRYISKFSDEQKEAVIKQLATSALLRDTLATTGGKILLDSTVDLIRNNMGKIISLSIDGFRKNQEVIEQAALQIGVGYDFMLNIARTLQAGDEHEQAMKSV